MAFERRPVALSGQADDSYSDELPSSRGALMLRTITLVFCLAAVVPAQRGFRPLRVTVDKDGLYLLSYARIAEHVDMRTVSPDSLTLVQDGVQVPIEIRGGQDGRLDPGDSVIFYGRRGTGPHSKDGVYVLKHARNPRRIGRLPPPPYPGKSPTRQDASSSSRRTDSSPPSLVSARTSSAAVASEATGTGTRSSPQRTPHRAPGPARPASARSSPSPAVRGARSW